MAKICNRCDRNYDIREWVCPHCGAANNEVNPFDNDVTVRPEVAEARKILLGNIEACDAAEKCFEIKPIVAFDGELEKAIKRAKYVGVRNWSIPTKYDALLAVLGGPGGFARQALETTIGANEEWTNRIPLGKLEWSLWVGSETTEQAASFIPGAGWLAAAGGEGLKGTIIGGNMKPRLLSLGLAAGASSINQVSMVAGSVATGPAAPVTLATLGTVSAAMGIAAASITILLRASLYMNTWHETLTALTQIKLKLEAATAAHPVSPQTRKKALQRIAELENKIAKTTRHGPRYQKIVDEREVIAEKAINKYQKLKAKVSNSSSDRGDRKSLLGNDALDYDDDDEDYGL